jgi:hypothetical protein
MKDNLFYELEKLQNDIILNNKDTIEANKVYQDLRMDLIHAQICEAEYFKFKNDKQQKKETNAHKTLQAAMQLEKNLA